MRSRALRGLSAALLVAGGSLALAQADLDVRFEPPPELHVGDRARLVLVADVPADMPVSVTPQATGDALEVVRGRLLRTDAQQPDARPLVFEIPVAARAAGNGVVRARVRSFTCDEDGDCRATSAEASLTVRVERAVGE